MKIVRGSEIRELTDVERAALVRAVDAMDRLLAHVGPDIPREVTEEYDAAVEDLARHHLTMRDLLDFHDEHHQQQEGAS